jgi:cellulase/cellobiase CelA1
MCGHGKIDAPEAGEWFHEHLVDMINNSDLQTK